VSKKSEGRFEKSYNDKSIGEHIIDGIIVTASLGLYEDTEKCTLTEKSTGERHTGYGSNKHSANDSAYSKFKK